MIGRAQALPGPTLATPLLNTMILYCISTCIYTVFPRLLAAATINFNSLVPWATIRGRLLPVFKEGYYFFLMFKLI